MRRYNFGKTTIDAYEFIEDHAWLPIHEPEMRSVVTKQSEELNKR